MNYLSSDLKTAVSMFVAMRKARKQKNIEESTVRQIPYMDTIKSGMCIGFLNTAEGIVLYNRSRAVNDKDIYEIAKAFFGRLTENEKLRLSHIPKDGEFIERIHFWEVALKPVMLPTQYRIAKLAIIHWFIHIKQIRMEGGCNAVSVN